MNFSRYLTILTIFIALIISAGCYSTTPIEPANTNAANSAKPANIAAITNASPASVNTNTNTAVVASSPAAPPASGSPAATISAYYQAIIKKDEEAFKKTLSKQTVQEMTADAKADGESSLIDYWLVSGVPPAPYETRNEKIQGDAALLEVKNPKTGEWTPTKLVKENGEWKLDYTHATVNELLFK